MRNFLRAVQSDFPFLQELRWNNEYLFRRAFNSVHDLDWRAFPLLRIGPGPIIDVGANRGQSIESFRLTMPGRPVISFEPNRILASRLQSRYANHADITIHSIGLGNEPGNFTLYIPKYKKWVFDGLASLDRSEAMAWLSPKTVWKFDPEQLRCLEVNCEIVKLDTLDLAPAILKIDVQGYELSVLKGGGATIKKNCPVILLEDATDDICAFLNGYGYRPYIYTKKGLVADRMDAVNCFFLCNKHLPGRGCECPELVAG